MDPNQQAPSPQYQPPQYQSGAPLPPVNASEPDYGDDGSGGHFRKWIKLAVVLILSLGIIGAGVYGINYILGLSAQEQDRLAAQIQEREEAEANLTYTGDGSDILKIASPTAVQECPAGYEQSGETCVKFEQKTVEAANYSCPSGYETDKSNETVTCFKTQGGTKEYVNATQGYGCPSGYVTSGQGAGTVCSKIATSKTEKVYSCASGYVKSGQGEGTNCIKTNEVEGKVLTSCPKNFVKAGSTVANTTCTETIKAKTVTANSCPSGYTKSGSTCTKAASAKTKTSCPSGYGGPFTSGTYKGKCTLRQYTATKANYKTACTSYGSDYVPVGDNCVKTYKINTLNNSIKTCTQGGITTSSPTAANGWVRTCKITKAGKKKVSGYVCPSGTPKWEKVNDQKCTRLLVAAQKVSTTYSCPTAGDTVSGSKCTRRVATTTSYVCTSDYKPSGSNCKRTAKFESTCESGFALSTVGNKPVCKKISIEAQRPSVSERCPSGYSHSGDECQKKITTTPTFGYQCQSGYKLEGTRCFHVVGGERVTTQPVVDYKCPKGYDFIGDDDNLKCTAQTNDEITIPTTYKCEEGWVKRFLGGDKFDCVLLRA